MRTFDQEKLLIAYELEQRLYDFAEELDVNGAKNVADFYAEDGVFRTGGDPVVGREAVIAFYVRRNENVAKYQREGQRTGRHTFCNVRAYVNDDGTATLRFINVNFAGEGPAPVQGLKGPSAVADCRMEFRREDDGVWRITDFAPSPALLGEDDFMKKMLSLAGK